MIVRSPDLLLYLVHVVFWSTFGCTLLIQRALDRRAAVAPANAPGAPVEETARFSRAILAFHMLAFFVMYFGIGNAVLPGRVPFWFQGQRWVGAALILGGAALMSWALVSFRSWRFRAKLDQGHELATGGPFRFVRHPIYLGLNLLALGSAIWTPTVIVWVACGLMLLGSDLRARAEETLLERAFGPSYRNYRARTRRFVPWIY